MKRRLVGPLLAVAATAAAMATLAPLAAADAVYHTEHLPLVPQNGAPLRSGFVQNVKANGPQVYAHEIFVLNGALPRSAYTVTRNFFFLDPVCGGGSPFQSAVATLETNPAGNARADIFVTPEEVPPPFRGVHGVFWTVENAAGDLVYRTACTAVTLD